MTFAIAHRHADRAVLDVIREVRPPFSPENVVREFSDVLNLHGLTRISGDRYAGDGRANSSSNSASATFPQKSQNPISISTCFPPSILGSSICSTTTA
jgi:hypothetical protein